MAAHCEFLLLVEATRTNEMLLNAQTCSDLGTNPERARQYREILRQDIEDELRCLLTALECDDRSELGRAAHTLKGLYGHLSNREPAELAGWLQHNAPSARPEQLHQVVEKLRATGNYSAAHEPRKDIP